MKLESERSSTARDETSSASAPSFVRAGSQSRAARSGIFSSSLEVLGERLNPSTWFGRDEKRTPKAAVSRLREVLDRDRALVAANPELNDLPDDELPSPELSTVAPVAPVAPVGSARTARVQADLVAPPVAAPAVAELPMVAAVAAVQGVAAHPMAATAPAPELPSSPKTLPPPALHRPGPPPPASARAAIDPGQMLDEPFAAMRPSPRSAPLGAFSEAPLQHYAYEPRAAAPRATGPAAEAPPSASVAPPAVAPAAPSVIASRVVMVCNEPIRTRTMARLLASQGHRDRALSIYEYLLSRNGSDELLRAEADALRSQPG